MAASSQGEPWQRASDGGESAPDSASPVLALTIVDCEPTSKTRGRVLVVVRDPTTNPTHPNTVSVPTQRIPIALQHVFAGALPVDCSSNTRWTSSRLASGHDPVIYAVEALCSRKLGIGDALERDAVLYEATTATMDVGYAEYGPRRREPIQMSNVLMRIHAGVSLFAAATASYSSMTWADPSELVDAFESHNPLSVVPNADPLELCIHGLCVSTTVALIRSGALARALTDELLRH
jgi:hypothetical protein